MTNLHKSVRIALLATAVVLATGTAAAIAAQWTAPVSMYHAKKMSMKVVKSESSTYGGTKRFTFKGCTRLAPKRFRCTVKASFPNYGSGTLAERVKVKLRFVANDEKLLTDAYGVLDHTNTACPSSANASAECTDYRTEQHWTWDTATGAWVQDTDYPPL